jgi:DNA-directed RNA polymerase subunit RPC12/RpoP
MIIKCPECGKEISDKAVQCIHCGYPLKELSNQNNNATDNTEEYKLVLVDFNEKSFSDRVFVSLFCDNDKEKYQQAISSIPCVLQEHIPKEQYLKIKATLDKDSITKMILIKQNENIADSIEYLEYVNSKDIVKCPKCGSKSIFSGQRGFSIITGFIGSGNTVNRCAKCGYKWKP